MHNHGFEMPALQSTCRNRIGRVISLAISIVSRSKMSAASEFKWLNSNGVESDRGFVVQSIGRFEIEYREGDRKLVVDVERGWLSESKSCVLIARRAFERWEDDLPGRLNPLEKQQEMLRNFTEAMEFQGIGVVVGGSETGLS